MEELLWFILLVGSDTECQILEVATICVILEHQILSLSFA